MANLFKDVYKKIVLPGELYKLHRRPMHPEIVINDSNTGVQIIDPWSEQIKAHIPFTENYNSSGATDEWCLRSDGKAMLALNEDNPTGCWLSLEGGASYDIECPLMPRIGDLRYVWDEDSFLLSGGKSYNFYKLGWKENIPVFTEISSIESRRAQWGWRIILSSISALNSNVLRVESDLFQMLYHNGVDKPEQIGLANWRDETVWSVIPPKPVPTVAGPFSLISTEGNKESIDIDLFPLSLIKLAALANQLFVMYEYEVYSLNQNGEIEFTYSAPENFCFSDLDTIPAKNGYPPALVLGCKSLNGSDSELLVFSL
ncbi:hypothetical protein Cylst_4374 [Cylindrospermum stagnale PCC 7417]|uniref:Uncharacterized protein n=1 Tax=Cylindrospermum stagnale PCC 7417 TaxID=56107 RepID=K9X2Z8_9NOST|nr:hypothetical protein [Cylindrospermum stagnale]AFZ26464.1 hypothetical protein Cylst_4374 [Cylindrospermum stagnale PCC 7417]